MVDVYSVPASTSLVDEINWLAPKRDKSSDGTIGNKAHSETSSDHNLDETGATPGEDVDSINEVHARDIDSSGPWPKGWSMERIVGLVVGNHRAGRDNRLQNVIYNRRIWSRSWGWTERPYTRANPHDKHAHFGFRYGSGGAGNPEQDTSPWGIKAARTRELEAQEMNAAETTAWARSDTGKDALGDAVLTAPIGNSGETLGVAIQRMRAVDKLIPEILKLVSADETVDTDELVAKLAPAIVALLPDLSGATPEEVEQAIRNGLGGLDSGTTTP